MLKVFLAEDEIVVREGLRDNIPWEQYGFTFVGDASDGEMALPLIRELKPDLLITDIKMPFMDGLALCAFVRKELPNTKIIIISGYDDFKYAQQAISIGVEKYLLKPITKNMMVEALVELQKKLDSDQLQQNYLNQFHREAQEHEQFRRRRFFEQIVQGELSVQELHETAESMDIDINAQSYNIVLLTIHGDDSNEKYDGYTEELAVLQDELVQYLLHRPEYLLFRWSMTTYAILIKGTPDSIDDTVSECVDIISRKCGEADGVIWYIAYSKPVERLSALPACFTHANRIMSYSYLMTDRHIFTDESVDEYNRMAPKSMDNCMIEPEQIKNFLANGYVHDVEEFVDQVLGKVGDNALSSFLFCRYLCMTICYAATQYIESIHCDSKEFLTPEMRNPDVNSTPDAAKEYTRMVLRRAIEARQQTYGERYRDLVRQALEYINGNYADETLSLNRVAKRVNISPNYFSAVFSQEVGQTFVEYLTQKRMSEACKLLRETDKRSSEIAALVGYKDPHYFSFLFKKTQGCTPRDYRGGKG